MLHAEWSHKRLHASANLDLREGERRGLSAISWCLLDKVRLHLQRYRGPRVTEERGQRDGVRRVFDEVRHWSPTGTLGVVTKGDAEGIPERESTPIPRVPVAESRRRSPLHTPHVMRGHSGLCLGPRERPRECSNRCSKLSSFAVTCGQMESVTSEGKATYDKCPRMGACRS